MSCHSGASNLTCYKFNHFEEAEVHLYCQFLDTEMAKKGQKYIYIFNHFSIMIWQKQTKIHLHFQSFLNNDLATTNKNTFTFSIISQYWAGKRYGRCKATSLTPSHKYVMSVCPPYKTIKATCHWPWAGNEFTAKEIIYCLSACMPGLLSLWSLYKHNCS